MRREPIAPTQPTAPDNVAPVGPVTPAPIGEHAAPGRRRQVGPYVVAAVEGRVYVDRALGCTDGVDAAAGFDLAAAVHDCAQVALDQLPLDQ